ncbi:hypothetical protein TNCV_1493151 [Trichonephila clavipes]|nr:hypothetical protein TNCV_1493151 [Trichonephila clavipes]
MRLAGDLYRVVFRPWIVIKEQMSGRGLWKRRVPWQQRAHQVLRKFSLPFSGFGKRNSTLQKGSVFNTRGLGGKHDSRARHRAKRGPASYGEKTDEEKDSIGTVFLDCICD